MADVDDVFLSEIEQWRIDLGRNIASHNDQLSQHELNLAVQKILDRIIFLRICEDRGMEPYGGLAALLPGAKIYPRLAELFGQAEDRYQSALFHFDRQKNRHAASDTWMLSLNIDDEVLKDILRKLYCPKSPFEFSLLGADILGQIYEQFVGRVIQLNNGQPANLGDKPNIQKAGGIYYTPSYLVDYIVAHTVGKLLAGKAPHEVAARNKTTWLPAKAGRPLKVLDPACGGGSFLIGAFQFLLDWYRQWYLQHDPRKYPDRIYQAPNEQWRLTTAERKRILLDHIYGVDLDRQALAVTKLSLLLQVMEDETTEAIPRHLSAKQRTLPDLTDNFKCGNSLIESDFYADPQFALLDESERLRINVFDWSGKNGFRKIMKTGGFDAVIGNPPYGAELAAPERVYCAKLMANGTTETAALFMTLARRLLTKGGINGFIVPKSLTFASNWRRVRQEMLGELTALIDVGQVWKRVKLEQVIYRIERGASLTAYSNGIRRESAITILGSIDKSACETFGFLLNGIEPIELTIAKKMISSNEYLSDVCANIRGGKLQAFMTDDDCGYRAVGGKQIQPYSLAGAKGNLSRQLTNIPLQAIVDPDSILVQNIVSHITRPMDHVKIIGTLVSEDDSRDIRILDTVNQLKPYSDVSSAFVLGLLHSRLVNWFVYRFIFAKAIRTMHFDTPVSSRIPIRMPSQQGKLVQESYDRIIQLVTSITDLGRARQKQRRTNQVRAINREISRCQEEIDWRIYKIFELSAEEVSVIERAMPTTSTIFK